MRLRTFFTILISCNLGFVCLSRLNPEASGEYAVADVGLVALLLIVALYHSHSQKNKRAAKICERNGLELIRMLNSPWSHIIASPAGTKPRHTHCGISEETLTFYFTSLHFLRSPDFLCPQCVIGLLAIERAVQQASKD